jgi:hypothetical protein
VIGEPVIEPAPDPQGVADDILSGEPRASTSTERTRRFRQRQRDREQGGEPEAPAAPGVVVNAKETGAMLDALWDTVLIPLVGKWKDGTPRLKSLTPEQANRLGEAHAPLVAKYLPLVSAWQVEISALIVTVAVVREAYNPRPSRPATFTLDPEGASDGPVAPEAEPVAP